MKRVYFAIVPVLLLLATSVAAGAAVGVGPDEPPPPPPGEPQRTEEAVQLREPVAASSAEYQEARQATEDDLDQLSPRARAIVTTPVEEVTVFEARPRDTPDDAPGGIRRAYGGHLGNGCWNVKISKVTKNSVGWVLTRAETTVMNYCISNDTFTATPSTYRYTNAHWGWVTCGWTNTYSGWDGPWYLYRAAGIARFALADSCFAPQVQLRNEIAARHDGHWWYWT